MLNPEQVYVGSLIRFVDKANQHSDLYNKIAVIIAVTDPEMFHCKFLHYRYQPNDFHYGNALYYEPVVP